MKNYYKFNVTEIINEEKKQNLCNTVVCVKLKVYVKIKIERKTGNFFKNFVWYALCKIQIFFFGKFDEIEKTQKKAAWCDWDSHTEGANQILNQEKSDVTFLRDKFTNISFIQTCFEMNYPHENIFGIIIIIYKNMEKY